jgi:hypothetical protein
MPGVVAKWSAAIAVVGILVLLGVQLFRGGTVETKTWEKYIDMVSMTMTVGGILGVGIGNRRATGRVQDSLDEINAKLEDK